MTEFEMQVAEALRTAARDVSVGDSCGDPEVEGGESCATWIAEQLAPRVAAAIDEAAKWATCDGEDSDDEARHDALGALRGETP